MWRNSRSMASRATLIRYQTCSTSNPQFVIHQGTPMSRTGQPMILAPVDWVEATSLRFSSRDQSMKDVDEAYGVWFETLYERNVNHPSTYIKRRSMTATQIDVSERAGTMLKQRIEAFLAKNGGRWSQCKRDRESNGLIQFVYDKVAEPQLSRLKKAQDQLNADSRYGVLYLFGNIDINVDIVKAGMDFVTGTAGAVTTAVGTNFKEWDTDEGEFKSKHDLLKLGNNNQHTFAGRADDAARWVLIGGRDSHGDLKQDLGLADGVDLGMTVAGHAWDATKSVGSELQKKSTGGYTRRAVGAWGTYGGGGKVGNAVVGGAVVAASAIADGIKKIYDLVESLVIGLVKWVYEKFQSIKDDPFEAVYGQIKFWLKAVIKNIAKDAAPFVGAGFDIADGLIETFKAIKEKVGAWALRRKIDIMVGHPSRLCARIEEAMEDSMLKGMWSIIKGSIQMVLAATIPGIQSLVSALTSGVEAIIRLVLKIMERSRIKKFLVLAKKYYETERTLRVETFDESGQKVITMHTKGGLIHNIDKFVDFYSEACEASPILAMLTINTGMCGSQWQMQNLLGAPGSSEEEQKEAFATGTEYFDRLKSYGCNYLKDCGFNFVANARDKVLIQKLLDNAKNPKRDPITSVITNPPLKEGVGNGNLAEV
jgi:hypothetical protein